MQHSDIAALMKGAAPAIRDYIRAAVAPLVDRIGALEQQLAEAVARDPRQAIDEAIAEALSKIEPAKDGTSVTLDDVAPMIEECVAAAVGAIEVPVPKDGESVTLEDVQPLIEEAVAAAVSELPPAEKGEPGPVGSLPQVEEWQDKVYYQGAVVTKDGGLWQAATDTGKQPGHEDWTCIVRAGTDGKPGRSFEIRGTYAADNEYSALDVVMLNGASFVAKQDDPGPCPGDGWQLFAAQGKRGNPGEAKKGDPGIRGLPGAPLQSATIDEHGLLTLTNGDGSTVTCDLYPLLSRLGGN